MSSPWPDSLFAAPILRGLDDAGRRAIEGAGRLRRFVEGQRIFTVDELGDSVFVIDRGEVELWSHGVLGQETLLRIARAGETFGEEAALPGALRRSEARARSEVTLAEIPAALFRRAFGRAGQDMDQTPEQRWLRRRASADLLQQIPLTADLPERERELVLDAVELVRMDRGQRIYGAGDRPDGLWLIAHGLVQLQREAGPGAIDDRVHVVAYLRDGDGFGDGELLEQRPRTLTAVAMGACQLLRIDPAAYRTLVDRNPELLARSRRIAEQRSQRQAAAVEAAPSSTRHVFADLYRMQMARSLLTIDQDACVRCGHCAWSCEQVHGVARLVRRGDKVVTRLNVIDGAGARELLLPNSCQHCKNPACMIDCPTGAIGRDVEGEVFIRESLCTGCSACAKACPWENIRMAPRPLDPGKPVAANFAPALQAAATRRSLTLEAMFPEVATKCDLCRDYQAPACVQSCPTQAIIRLEPERDFAEVAALLDLPDPSGRRRWSIPWGTLLMLPIAALAVALLIAVVGLRSRGWLIAAAGPGLLAGVLAALSMLALLAHAVPKRGVKRWMQRRVDSRRAQLAGASADPRPTRSRLRPFYLAHLGLGLLLPALVLAHAGWAPPANVAGLLTILAWLTIGLGLFGGACYGLIPRHLTRLERSGALPEDLASERERLLDRLQRELSGKSPVLKQLAATQLLPWARAPLGWVSLLFSGRDLGGAQARLRAQIEGQLPAPLQRDGDQPQARAEALAGLDPLLRTCVELRALPARRVLTSLLRGWLAPHVLTTGALLVALFTHVLLVLWP